MAVQVRERVRQAREPGGGARVAGRGARQAASDGPVARDAAARASDSYHHGNLRTALVEAALAIVRDRGLAALGLRCTARAAGVSQTAPYHHFGSKEGLLAAVAAEAFRRIVRVQEEAIAGVTCTPEEPEAKVRVLGRTYVRFARENPELYRLMFGPALVNRDAYPELVEAYSAAYRFIEEATAERLALLGADDVPVALAVTAAWSMVHGLSQLLNDGKVVPGEGGVPEEAELVEALLGGLDPLALAAGAREHPAS